MVIMDAEALDMVKAYHEHQAFDAWQHLIPAALRKNCLTRRPCNHGVRNGKICLNAVSCSPENISVCCK